jgi:hypothetical protein
MKYASDAIPTTLFWNRTLNQDTAGKGTLGEWTVNSPLIGDGKGKADGNPWHGHCKVAATKQPSPNTEKNST